MGKGCYLAIPDESAALTCGLINRARGVRKSERRLKLFYNNGLRLNFFLFFHPSRALRLLTLIYINKPGGDFHEM